MDGILLVDKPAGWTSFDVVNKVRSCLRQQLTADSSQLTTASPKVKVGHTGTLDPLATGLLVILIGRYTKRAEEFTKLDKTYEVTMKLGESSSTGDEEGVKTAVSTAKPSKNDISAVLKRFEGQIEQIPPQYSAIKINGQRAYKLAREGKEFTLEPRQITIYRLQLTDFSYPTVKFTAEVSSGTYIRTLVEDIGKQLGTGAYMTALRRTKVGKFNISASLLTDKLNPETISKNIVLTQ